MITKIEKNSFTGRKIYHLTDKFYMAMADTEFPGRTESADEYFHWLRRHGGLSCGPDEQIIIDGPGKWHIEPMAEKPSLEEKRR